MANNHLPKILGLCVFFLLSFGFFEYVPGLFWTKELWLVFTAVYLIGFILRKLMCRKVRFSYFELYVLLLCLMPIYAAVQAHYEFGQPIIYGALAQRSIVLAASALMLLELEKKRLIDIHLIGSSLLLLAWANLIYYTFLVVLIPAELFSGSAGFVTGNDMAGYDYQINSTFVIIGFLYYLHKGIIQNSGKSILLVMPFIVFLIVVDGGRSMLVSLCFALIVSLSRKLSFRAILSLLPKVVLGLLLISGGLLVTKGDYIMELKGRFEDAFAVVLTAEEGKDASSNARITETLIALPFIEKNLIFGSGAISNQWQGGYRSKLGYFYPSDIGIIGALYLYGVLGVSFFMLQFLFLKRWVNKVPLERSNAFLDGIVCFLIYFSVHSIVNGKFVHSIEVGLVLIAVVYIYVKEEAIRFKLEPNGLVPKNA